MQRCKAAGIYAAAGVAVVGVAALLWKNGSFTRIGAGVTERTVAATASAGFTAKDIVITGQVHVTRDEVLDQLGVRRGTPVLTVDLSAARDSLMKMPWVRDVRISRRLPATIAVDITERTPVALWQVNRRISLVDAEGTVLTTEGLGAYHDLPLVVGEGAPQDTAALLGLLKAEPTIESQVASAVRIGNRRWDLHLKNGMVVLLPATDEGLALARLARAAQSAALLTKNVVRIDLRLPDRLVVAPGLPVKEDKENI